MAIEAKSLNEPLENSYRLYDIIYMIDFVTDAHPSSNDSPTSPDVLIIPHF